MQIEACEDCNICDDVAQVDSFMYSFGYPEDGNQFWLCAMCAEAREYYY